MATDTGFQKLTRRWGIALTGGIASGKSTIGRSLKARGYTVIDADQVSRLVVLPGTEGLREVVATFGPSVLDSAGALDRAKMREIIFADEGQRQKLESIIHHRLAAATESLLRDEGLFLSPRRWFYEASLIFERQRETDFSQVWVAYCPRDVQIARVMARDGIDRPKAEAVLKAQMSPEEKARRADRVLDTDCTPEELERRLSHALKSLEEGDNRE